MMLDFKQLIQTHKIKPKGIIQLGAHFFQEKETFIACGFKQFVLIEPLKHAFAVLRERVKGLDHAILYNVAVSDVEGEFEMQCDETNQGQSSSLLTAKEHLVKYPGILFSKKETVKVELIENLVFDRKEYNCLVMDLQGNELNALIGAGNLLTYIDCIYTEVNFIEMYEGCVLIGQLDAYLKGYGFERIATGQNHNDQGWSDAFYLKRY